MTGRRADKVAWGVVYFLLAVGATLVLLGVWALADLVL